MLSEKRCAACGVVKSASAFHTKDKQGRLKSRCRDCLGPTKARQKRDYDRRCRRETLVAYSANPPACACCGESHIEFLVIDHINGGGNKHRKQLSSMSALYRWLKNNGYPPGFRVLCQNCNSARGLYGYCPHERQRRLNEADSVATSS